jgi:hypothetical protein
MKYARLLSLFFAALLLQITACKDKDDDPEPISKTDLLTAKTWKMNKVLGNGLNITNEPVVQEYKDMEITFRPDGTYVGSTTDGTVEGTWAFAENETELVFDPGTTDAYTWEIVELKENSLKLRSSLFIPFINSSMLVVFEMVPA